MVLTVGRVCALVGFAHCSRVAGKRTHPWIDTAATAPDPPRRGSSAFSVFCGSLGQGGHRADRKNHIHPATWAQQDMSPTFAEDIPLPESVLTADVFKLLPGGRHLLALVGEETIELWNLTYKYRSTPVLDVSCLPLFEDFIRYKRNSQTGSARAWFNYRGPLGLVTPWFGEKHLKGDILSSSSTLWIVINKLRTGNGLHSPLGKHDLAFFFFPIGNVILSTSLRNDRMLLHPCHRNDLFASHRSSDELPREQGERPYPITFALSVEAVRNKIVQADGEDVAVLPCQTHNGIIPVGRHEAIYDIAALRIRVDGVDGPPVARASVEDDDGRAYLQRLALLVVVGDVLCGGEDKKVERRDVVQGSDLSGDGFGGPLHGETRSVQTTNGEQACYHRWLDGRSVAWTGNPPDLEGARESCDWLQDEGREVPKLFALLEMRGQVDQTEKADAGARVSHIHLYDARLPMRGGSASVLDEQHECTSVCLSVLNIHIREPAIQFYVTRELAIAQSEDAELRWADTDWFGKDEQSAHMVDDWGRTGGFSHVNLERGDVRQVR
ncbi:hypothetical protein K438DRAFT_1761118 [Mycena galopus ATCC 62051]|nr:hypothetical protein K438DRAFT_1761118 [Mycena galopus ATCC 62051]